MKITKLRSKGISIFLLLCFVSMFIDVKIVSAITLEGYENQLKPRASDRMTYELPDGTRIIPEYRQQITIYNIDSVKFHMEADDLISAKMNGYNGWQNAEKKVWVSFKPSAAFIKKEQSFALLIAGYAAANKRKKVVILTGVGVKVKEHEFRDITTGEPTHTEVNIGGQSYKANIGAATAMELCRKGFEVRMVARTEDKLKIVQEWVKNIIPGAVINYSAFAISDTKAVAALIESIPIDKDVYWVQSVGLGGGTVKIKDDNPYLPIEEISPELMEAELSVLTDTIKFLQTALPRFRQQKETRVCIVSSMSAIRSIPYGSIHNAAKGSISRFTNAAMLELDKEGIYITDVRPGGVDTGMYDAQVVQNSVTRIAERFDYDWSEANGGIRLAPPSSVGKMIAEVLSSEAHITSLNLVARGQWPHEGS